MAKNKDSTHTRSYIPIVIMLSRIISAPFLFFWYLFNQQIWVITLFIILVFSDYLDGYFARTFKSAVRSPLVTYLDATADFIMILTMFAGFVVTQIYPVWVLFIISGLFLQFLLTSGRRRPRYDPIGKYTGVYLFMMILVTLMFPNSSVYWIVSIGIIGFMIISVTSRIVFLYRPR